MEVKPGYKQTEVGVIPEEWGIRPLGLICDVRDGTHESPRFYKDGVPFVTSKNIVDGRLDLENVSFISQSDAVEFDKRSKVDRNDILLSMIGTIGSAVLVDCEPDFCIKNVALIKPRKVAPTYLIRLINAPVFQKYLADNLDGGIQKFISLGKLRQLSIPLPDDAEQSAIAEALSDVDGLLGGLDRLIAKKRDLKQAAMQQLLTGQTRLPGFHGEWEVKRLGDIAEIVMGQSPSSSNYNTTGMGLPLIQGNADIDNRKTIKRIFTTQITKRGRNGDILMSVRAPVGEVSRAVFDVCLGRGVCAIRYDNDFMYHCLIYLEPTWVKHSKGSTFDSVNSADVKSLEIHLPTDQAEQTAIAAVLSEMDGELGKLEERREKARALKQAMMQELLTGRTRLV